MVALGSQVEVLGHRVLPVNLLSSSPLFFLFLSSVNMLDPSFKSFCHKYALIRDCIFMVRPTGFDGNSLLSTTSISVMRSALLWHMRFKRGERKEREARVEELAKA